jgi:hypothetical protein
MTSKVSTELPQTLPGRKVALTVKSGQFYMKMSIAAASQMCSLCKNNLLSATHGERTKQLMNINERVVIGENGFAFHVECWEQWKEQSQAAGSNGVVPCPVTGLPFKPKARIITNSLYTGLEFNKSGKLIEN